MHRKKIPLKVRIMTGIFLSCKKATELMERKAEGNIGFIENIQLFWHKGMCKVCALYEKQTRLLNRLLQKHLLQRKAAPLSESESSTLRAKIISEIEKK